MDLQEIRCEGVDWMIMSSMADSFEQGNRALDYIKGGGIS
jgi:hypothetical protein